VTNDVTDADRACGLNGRVVEAAAIEALLDSGIRVTRGNALGDVTLRIRFSTLHFSALDVCVSSTHVDIQTWGSVAAAYTRQVVRAWVALDEVGTLISSGRREHPLRLAREVRELTERVATHIRLANQ